MYKPIKRIMDISIALFALLLLLPLLFIISMVLLFTGERQVIYKQKRVGYRNRPFFIWKFATMLKNSPNMGTGEITLRNDPRVLPFGRFLRKTKLNELPQIINVLKGEMSIVGPRPLMEVSFQLYSAEDRANIYSVRPGVTGIGSLVFRDEEKIVSAASDPRKMYETIYPYKARLEQWYRAHLSLFTDCKIIIITALAVIAPTAIKPERYFKGLPGRPF